MADTTYEKIPLDLPASPKPAHSPEELDTPRTPATPGFEKKTMLKRLTDGVRGSNLLSPDTPTTPGTPNFEKKSLLKRVTGTYQPTKEELEADPLERLQRQDTVCAKVVLFAWQQAIDQSNRSTSNDVFED